MQPPIVAEKAPKQVGLYEIGEEIGRGHAAVVYRATDTLYDREVALKVLHPYFAHYLSFARHFIAQGREGMRLRHPNIVQVFDAGQSEGVAYIAQELFTGGSLADMIQARGGPFTLDEAIAVIDQAAAGLDHAHQLGFLHRNLKPSNLFFADHGRIQIADFSATLPPGGSPPANYPMSAPTFMAPEQARGEGAVDQRADIYSLGAVAFLLLTGQPPFEAENPLVLLRKIIEDTPPLLERFQPDVDPGVAQAISQVLAKRPSARYLTASAFSQALAHGQPIATRPAQHATLPTPAIPIAPQGSAAFPPSPSRPRTNSAPTTFTFTRRTVMMAGMLMVTLFLLLLVIAAAAPGFYRRIAGIETPTAVLAVLPVPTYTVPLPTTQGVTPVVDSLDAVVIAAATSPIAAVAPISTTAPPPTVRVIIGSAAQVTPLPTSTSSPTSSTTPTAPPFTASNLRSTPENILVGLPLLVEAQVTATVAVTGAVDGTVAAVASPSPSGRIAYTVHNPKTDQLDTVIYTIATGERWPVLAAKRQPDFNNQSDLMLNSEGGGFDGLVIMRASGEFVTIASAFAEDARGHWSPTNKTIVFDSTLVGDGRHRLYLQQDTEYGQPVAPVMYDVWEIFGRYPVFLLDGRIAYNGCDVWDNASTCGIFVMDPQGGQPQNLTTSPGDIPTDNLGNQILAMSDRGGNWNVYLVNSQSGVTRQLTDDRGRDGLATASPDGAFIAFLTDREGKWAVYVMRPDGSEQRKLFDLNGDYGTGPQDWRHERLSWGR